MDLILILIAVLAPVAVAILLWALLRVATQDLVRPPRVQDDTDTDASLARWGYLHDRRGD